MYKLYGDGIHDDVCAIQEMLDSGASLVELPVPDVHYSISKPLKINSNQTLKMGETTTIKLLPRSNCFMITNSEEGAHDIAIEGGIWDFNNREQAPNPIKAGEFRKMARHWDGKADTIVTYEEGMYRGSVMHFYKVTRLSIHNLTVKDPVTYCVEMAYIKYFTIENIKFDQNLGNPTAENMDGIHIDGGCRFGSIRNVQGTCYDDIVALNADDGCDGPIEDIQIDGVFGENSLRAVRLLSTKSPISRISVSNVFGTYYQNCIVLAYFYPRTGVRGKMNHISIRNIYGNNAHRIPEYNKGDDSFYSFSFIWVDNDVDIDFLAIDNMCRNEEISGVETIRVCEKAHIKNLSLSNILQQNSTNFEFPLFTNYGTIDKLYMYNVNSDKGKIIDNKGDIGQMI